MMDLFLTTIDLDERADFMIPVIFSKCVHLKRFYSNDGPGTYESVICEINKNDSAGCAFCPVYISLQGTTQDSMNTYFQKREV